MSLATVPGTLYVVATPIGHMEDITIRALKILSQVELIAAEDTRQTQKLLKYHEISTPLFACHDHNESQCAEKIIKLLKTEKAVALVSDAGTPTVSDPGYRVVSMAIQAEMPVVPVPGVSAAMTALCVSGFPTDSFIFQGFLPKKQGKRNQVLKQLMNETRTLIFYESPKRIIALLEALHQNLGDRPAMLGRELTKSYEECIRGKLSEIIEIMHQKKAVKGECTLLVAGYTGTKGMDDTDLYHQVKIYLGENKELPLSQCVKDMVALLDEPRKKIYRIALEINNRNL